ncbi:MAG: ribosome maturation factor RimP [Deltaproteobacteria bacterium]|nr:ribosome maturation factor RimP [Deltaproteobacteria bacterium]
MERLALASAADKAEVVLAEPIAAAGYSLLLCEVTGSSTRPTLRVYIEKPDGSNVDIGDCVKVNDAVTDLLDTEELFTTQYLLEVSSPGLSRPLKRVEHFEAQVGKLINFRTWEPIEGRRNWKVTLVGVEHDLLVVDWDGREVRVPLPAIEIANLVDIPPPKGQKKGGGNRRQKKKGKGKRK